MPFPSRGPDGPAPRSRLPPGRRFSPPDAELEAEAVHGVGVTAAEAGRGSSGAPERPVPEALPDHGSRAACGRGPESRACPARAPCFPAVRGAARRPAMLSSACSAAVRPNRASHAAVTDGGAVRRHRQHRLEGFRVLVVTVVIPLPDIMGSPTGRKPGSAPGPGWSP